VTKNDNKQLAISETELNSVLVLYSNGKISEAITEIKILNDKYPNVPFLFNILGACYQSQGHLEVSIKLFKTAISIKSDYAEAHFNLGVVLKIIGHLPDAVESYKKAISFEPRYFDAYNNLGNLLFQMGLFEESIKIYKNAILIKPNLSNVHNNLAGVFKFLGRLDDAKKYYRKAIEINPKYSEAYNNLGVILKKTNHLEEALICFEKAERLNPETEFILGPLLQIKKNLCNWDDLEAKIDNLSKDIKKKKKSVAPFFLLGLLDSPILQRINTEIYVNKKHPKATNLEPLSQYSRHKKIRIGYFSADFHNHATMHLMAELFECHNKNSYEVFAFSFGPNFDNDEWRVRVEESFDSFIDVSSKSDLEISTIARQMEIDIAIDLKGFTKDSRPNIFMERSAPIQVNYLGYPGTLGADYFDYLIADKILVPIKNQKYYSEKIVYMPDSYQVNMSERNISKVKISRKKLGLPKKSFVFCCFNNTYKITPSVFQSWMRILSKVNDSVLWLFVKNKTARKNLQKEAEKLGIDKNRVVFATFMAVEEHLNRIRHADLFIDTIPYNAHTTASDALRVGIPVITCQGESFASRVAASLLNSINLPELITKSQEDYEFLAIELATNPRKLKIIKNKLIKNLSISPLFNPLLFTQNLELAYSAIYERYHEGLEPDHIFIKNSE
jgi:protein O-GlcNAc transferase